MALNSSGPISLAGTTAGQSIEIENGGNGTTQISLNDAAVRTLAGVPSGAITMPTNFWGKSNRAAVSYTYSSNTTNASLNLSSLGGYVSGKTDFTITVNSGVYLWSNSTGSYALNITGSTTGDTITLVNNGFIMGQGGNGGSEFVRTGRVNPTSGGPAINFGFGADGATITNTSGYIGGGGGGGGRGYYSGAGGGAGGGNGGGAEDGNRAYAPTSAGGSIGASGANGTYGITIDYSYGGIIGYAQAGGGGGRIMPGTGGTYSQPVGGVVVGNGGGAGGGAASISYSTAATGGSAGNAGQSYGSWNWNTGGGGGGYGASGGSGGYPNGGASGGKAVNLNGKSITWTGGSSSSSRAYGTVS